MLCLLSHHTNESYIPRSQILRCCFLWAVLHISSLHIYAEHWAMNHRCMAAWNFLTSPSQVNIHTLPPKYLSPVRKKSRTKDYYLSSIHCHAAPFQLVIVALTRGWQGKAMTTPTFDLYRPWVIGNTPWNLFHMYFHTFFVEKWTTGYTFYSKQYTCNLQFKAGQSLLYFP
mgnify:CR=1 FL=1